MNPNYSRSLCWAAVHTVSVERHDDFARPIIGPLTAAVRRLGVRVGEPDVIRVGANVVVHLQPAPIVARVATLTAEMRGDALDYLRREKETTVALRSRGVRVVSPTTLVDPGPHTAEGFAFLLLTHVELEPVDLASHDHATRAGRAFAELSMALAELPPEVGRGDEGHPWAEIERLLQTVSPTVDAAAVAHIREMVDTLRTSEPGDAHQLVHGDAHKGNVALHNGEIIWFDFEDANRRPVAWDLATLRRAWPAAGDTACQLLGVDPTSNSMRWHHELREVYALLWHLFLNARLARDPAPAADRLATWQARISAGAD